MKLNKKRILILVSLMCLLILFVFTLCSFDLPDYPDQASELLSVSGYLNSSEAEYIKNILDYQDLCGQFNSLVPLCISHNPDGYISCLFALPSSTLTYSTTGQASQTRFMYELTGTQNNAFISIGFSTEGFAIYSVYSAASVSILRDHILYFRTSFSSSLVKNSRYDYDSSTSSIRSDISDVYNYWNGYISRLSGSGSGASSEELESAYDSGFADGFDSGYYDGLESGLVWGEELGYQEGYTEGYQEGIGTGYAHGYLAGEAAGYDTGYDDGYQDGYETGYDSGYAEAERETVIEYVEPVELDIPHIFNSIGAVPRQVLHGVDFEIFGVPILGVLLSILVLTISIFVIRKIK